MLLITHYEDEKYAFKNKDIENIFEQNKEWIKSKTKKDPNFFKEYLGGGHKPSYLWIGEYVWLAVL